MDRVMLRRVSACAALGLGLGGASAQEVLLKNDSLVDGSQASIQAGFVNNEIAAATFTVPSNMFPLWVKRVQIFWLSQSGNSVNNVQESINIYTGYLPAPALVYESDPPQFFDGFLNEFDFSDQRIIIANPALLTVGLKFADAPGCQFPPCDPTRASVVTDRNGCQPGKNLIYAIPPGAWFNSCSLGVTGDFVIRAVVERWVCRPDVDGDGFVTGDDFSLFVTWFETGDPRGDYDGDGFLTGDDFILFVTDFEAGC